MNDVYQGSQLVDISSSEVDKIRSKGVNAGCRLWSHPAIDWIFITSLKVIV